MVCSAEWRSHSASSLILMSTYIWKPRCIDHVTLRDMISNWPCMAMLLVLHACDVSRTACILRGTWRGASSHWRWHSASIEGAAWAGKQNENKRWFKGKQESLETRQKTDGSHTWMQFFMLSLLGFSSTIFEAYFKARPYILFTRACLYENINTWAKQNDRCRLAEDSFNLYKVAFSV